MAAVRSFEGRMRVSNAFESAVQSTGDRFAERVVLGAWKWKLNYSSSSCGIVKVGERRFFFRERIAGIQKVDIYSGEFGI